MIEAEADMGNTTKALVKQQETGMALTGNGGLLESHLMVETKSTMEIMEEREVDMIGLQVHLVCFNFFSLQC